MAVAVRSVGAPDETNTYDDNVTPGDPAGLATGDIQILVECLTGFGTSPSLPTFKSLTSGWTQILDTGEVTAATGNKIARMRVSWALHSATDPISDTNADGSNLGGTPTATNYLHRAIRIAVSGADTSDPIDVSGHSGGSAMAVTNAFSMSGLTTTEADTLILGALLSTDDNTFSGYGFGTAPTSVTEHYDTPSATGGDDGLAIISGAKATAGATGTFTATCSAPAGFEDPNLGALIAIKPPAVSAPSGAPSFVAAGTVVETSTKASGVTPGLPSGWASGDKHILVMQATCFGGTLAAGANDIPTINAPTGWSAIENVVSFDITGTSTRKVRLVVCHRDAQASDSAPTVQMNNDGLATGSGKDFLFRAVILGYRDADTRISTSIATSMDSTNTPFSATAVSRVDDVRAIAIASISNDATTTSTFTGVTSVTERLDSTSATGADGGLAVIDGEVATEGTTFGPATFTLSGGDTAPTVVVLIALEVPNTVAPAAPSGLTLSEPVAGTVRAQFTMPPDLDTDIYVVRYKAGSAQTFSGIDDGTQHTPTTAAPSVGAAIDVSASGFSASTTYTIGVAAIDEVGNVSTFTTADITTGAPSSGGGGSGETPTVLQLAQALVLDTAGLIASQQEVIDSATIAADVAEASRDLRLIEAAARSAEACLSYVEELT